MTTAIEQDIRSIPAILRQTYQRVEAYRAQLAPFFEGPLAFLGCGSSYNVSAALAAFYEQEKGAPGQALFPSDYRPRKGWTNIAISRSGTTTELLTALRRAKAEGIRTLVLVGDSGSPAEELADAVLPLEFASEQGVVQTRFIVAVSLALRLLIAGEQPGLAEEIEQALNTFDAKPYLRFNHVVYLGRGWRYGLARTAALNLQETAILVPESHQTLDYRHGPIASLDENSLVWCLDGKDDPAVAAVIEDVRKTGASVYWPGVDPLVTIAQGQLFSLRKAEARGVDPMAPRHLSRSIVLSETEA
ncbi:fructoselysine-6-P-deglycase FrlB-like protein [Thermosporothrix hazakensis]|uniref:Fructoselysine-6-P-deglycase FrlB-like protein n=2 Tax=Thermosporothrix TaxID=768650 RepID=A0A326U8N0_THEHA|nr:SIS domain-containing protein [Thermosporothrix hazakensis]PZW29555.1 fructoselysine-6-P-deglycase FrlB-like protein [Thermosporothrix hazakensis]BBH85842.1 aminotransferase [Thermosporothrix sp. COM3]GCE45731.1 aminotransferase [Thermosporothrix hazakensis]